MKCFSAGKIIDLQFRAEIFLFTEPFIDGMIASIPDMLQEGHNLDFKTKCSIVINRYINRELARPMPLETVANVRIEDKIFDAIRACLLIKEFVILKNAFFK